MTANARPTSKDELDKRKEKERRREEKELRKIAKAAGIKMPKLPAPSSGMPATVPISEPMASFSQGGIASESSQLKKEGWTTVGAPTGTGFKKSGWATVGSAPQSSSSGFSASSLAPTGAQTTIDVPSHTAANSPASSAPGFRQAGWASLDPVNPQQSRRPQPQADPHSSPTQPSYASQAPSQAPAATTPPKPKATDPRPSGGGGWKQFQSSMRGKSRR